MQVLQAQVVEAVLDLLGVDVEGDELPGLIEETTGEPLSPADEEDYLLRLRNLQELLSDMERELDLMIRTSSKDP